MCNSKVFFFPGLVRSLTHVTYAHMHAFENIDVDAMRHQAEQAREEEEEMTACKKRVHGSATQQGAATRARYIYVSVSET